MPEEIKEKPVWYVGFVNRRRRIREEKLKGFYDSRPHMLWAMRRKAKQRGLPIDLSIKASELPFPKNCPCCGIELRSEIGRLSDHSPTLDRIVPSLGYVRTNIHVICHKCNRIKNDATAEELFMVADFLALVTGEKYESSGKEEDIRQRVYERLESRSQEF